MTDTQRQHKERCLQLIEDRLGWGSSADWSNMDFQRLSDLIYEETKVLLSASTLKRLWGKVNYEGNPAPSTLNTLAVFLGYENWRTFVSHECSTRPAHIPPTVPHAKARSISFWKPIVWLVIVAICLCFAYAFLYQKDNRKILEKQGLSATDFSFSSKPLAKGIPNSVIFTYDASEAPVDSPIYIQQSWDARRRKQVAKDQHQFTSVYYEPGFFTAKLVVGKQVVKEHPLLIPSEGWLATIVRNPVPIYLERTNYTKKDQLSIPVSLIEKYKVSLMPQAPTVRYFNVGNFKTLAVGDFFFEAWMKNNYPAGNNACQFSQAMLITDGAPITIPLCIKGCVSELSLMSVDQMVSGKNADLSGFGVDFANWVKVSCKGNKEHIQYFVDDRLAFDVPLSSQQTQIVGLNFTFMGTGAVKGIKLGHANEVVYQEF
ncbi:hypothetical protein [Olivibacter sp. XZL3]|uniref:hypothetical protein n=1 Tax=Olivibacter sp. XZL3 TaxID=1735116 RepID=UPI0010646473|nr:hypothetical protein [Olivibacter sp. XZL3]